MKKAIQTILFSIATCAVLSAVSASVSHAGNVTGKVSEIRVRKSGSIYFKLEGNPNLCTGASSSASTGHLLPSATDPDTRKIFHATLLAAKLAGATVQVVTIDGAGGTGCAVDTIYVK